MTLVTSEHPKMVDMVPYLSIVGKPCILEHTHLCIGQYLSVLTFRRDVLQVGYSPLSLYYILLLISNMLFDYHSM